MRGRLRTLLSITVLVLPIIVTILSNKPVFADTYTVTNTNDSGAGSLRQAILDANANPGADIITFNIPPTDTGYYSPAPGIGWWRIVVSSTLPTITEAVTIDGSTQTTNRGDTNPGQVGTGGTVGVDRLPLSRYNKPEIELTTSATINNGLTLQANNIVVRGLAIYGFKRNSANVSNAQIRISGGNNLLIENCLIGTRADGSDPGFDTRTSGIYSTSSGKGTIQNNYIGYNASGIYLDGASNWTIAGNEIFQNTLRYENSGIELPLNANSITVRGNLCRDNGGAGIDSYRGAGTFTIENNTVRGNGLVGFNASGIRLYGSNNVIRKNIVTGNIGPGIVVPFVVGTYQNNNQTISQNSCYDNGGLGIDLVRDSGSEQVHARRGDGININDGIYNATYGNRGIDYPVITVAELVGNTLRLQGYIGTTATGTTFSGATVEFFIAAPDPTGYGEGKTYLGNCTTGATNSFSCNIDVTGKGLVSTNQITATATDATGNTSEFGTFFNITPLNNPVLTLEVTPPSYAFAGQNVVYTAATRNTSDSIAYNATYVWQLPAQMTFVSASHPATYNPTTRTVTFNLGNISPSGKISGFATVKIDPAVSDGTLLTSSSTLSWQNVLGQPAGTVTHSSTIVVYTYPTLTLDWSVPPTGYAGESILANGILHNPGTSTAYNAMLVVQLPAGMTFVSSSHGAIWNPISRIITWNLGNIPAGTNMNGWYTVSTDPAIADDTILDITSQLTWQDAIGNNYGPLEQTQSIRIKNKPSITITKLGPTEASIGSNITYTGTLTNVGGSAAYNVILIDYLPQGMTFISSSHTAVYNPANRTVTWMLGTVYSGAYIDGWVTVQIDNTVADNTRLINNFQVTWQDNDGVNYGPSSASWEVIAQTNPLLTLTKEGPSEAVVGDYITFTGTLANIGSIAARNVTLVDYLPQGMTFISSSHAAVYDAVNRTVTWSLGTINGGVAITGWIAVRVDSSVTNGSRLINTFQTRWQDGSSNNYGPVSASKEVTAYTRPILSINKTGPAYAIPGGTVTFNITLTNSGGLNASNVILRDILPIKYSYVSSSPAGQHSSGIVTWNLGTIAAGTTATFSVTALVDAATTDGTQLVNNADVSWRDMQNNSYGPIGSSVTTVILGNPKLLVTKTGPTNTEPGARCTYTVVVTNIGNTPATSVTLTDILPSKMTFVSCSDGGAYTPPGIITWNLGTINSSSSKSVSLTVQVDLGITQNTELKNSASANWQDTMGNNYGPALGTATTTVYPYPMLNISLTGPAIGNLNSLLTYKITVNNSSTQVASNAAVRFMFPVGFTFNQASNQGSYSNGVVSWPLFNLSPDNSRVFTVTVVPSGVPAGVTLISTASIGWQYPAGTDRGPLFVNLQTSISQALPPPPPPPTPPPAPPTPPSSSPNISERQIATPPRITVKYLDIQPKQSKANQVITIFANMANSGGSSGDYIATLKINGKVEEKRTGKVGAHSAVPLKFEVIRNEPGTYTVDINGQQSHFIIIDEQSRTRSSKTIPLIGFVICAIGVIIVSALLIRRMRADY